MSNGIKVIKRDGVTTHLDLEKIHTMVEFACEGLAGVSASQVEINSGIQFYDGITTEEIQQILIKSASDLITLDNPNYQYVAARLLLYGVRKAVFGKDGWEKAHPSLHDHAKACVDKRLYDWVIYNKYSDEEWDKIDSWVDHERDHYFTYAGLRQVVDKYLVQDRSTGKVFESPQFMYLSLIHISEPTRPY